MRSIAAVNSMACVQVSQTGTVVMDLQNIKSIGQWVKGND